MAERTAQHTSFAIERDYAATPTQVFHAFADPAAKRRWFVGPAGRWTELKREQDFRIGGRERVSGAFTGGPVSTFDCHYLDIVPNQRIVYSYAMRLDERLISISLATLEFNTAGAGTRFVFTEQCVYLDGYSDPGGRERERGTRGLLDNLDAALKAGP